MIEDGFEQMAALGLCSRELFLQSVADCHQLVHLGRDAALFRKRRQRNRKATNVVSLETGFPRSIGRFHKLELVVPSEP